MTDNAPSTLLTALGIAAFERAPDNAFQPVAALPAWFSRLSSDGTFPFLGHILEEAYVFWRAGADGSREWGPCAAEDDNGVEFHSLVKALQIGTHAYLVFQVDEGAERLRQGLQKARSDALAGRERPPRR